jgi:RNA exonuclease 1
MILVQGIEPSTLGLPNEISNNLPQSLNPNPDAARISKLPIFQQLFSHYCPTRAPGDTRKLHSVSQTLLHAPMSAGDKRIREAERARLAEQASGSDDPSLYLLPVEEFAEQGYILPTYPFDIATKQVGGKEGKKAAKQRDSRPFEDWLRPDGLVETPQPLDLDDDETQPLMKIVGIDCEMVSSLTYRRLIVNL